MRAWMEHVEPNTAEHSVHDSEERARAPRAARTRDPETKPEWEGLCRMPEVVLYRERDARVYELYEPIINLTHAAATWQHAALGHPVLHDDSMSSMRRSQPCLPRDLQPIHSRSSTGASSPPLASSAKVASPRVRRRPSRNALPRTVRLYSSGRRSR